MNSAGIEVRERDYSDYVQSVSDVSVGCIGEAKRGPLVPTLITSQEELIKIFGEPTEGSYGIYGAYSALKNVSSLFYQRIVGKGASAAAGQAGVDKFLFTMINPGIEYNNYKLEIAKLDESYTLTLKDTTDKVVETLEGLSDVEDNEKYLVTVINETSEYLSVIANDLGDLVEGELTFLGGLDGAKHATAGTKEDEFLFRSKYPDSSINGCLVQISDTDNFGYFSVKLVDKNGNLIELFNNVTKDKSDDRYVERFINSNSIRLEVVLNESGQDKKEYTFSGGRDGIDTITSADIIGDPAEGSGMQSFANPETIEINLMMIPGNTSPEVNASAVTLAEGRGDIIYIADTPKGLSAQSAVDYINGEGIYSNGYTFNSSYAAAYYPWVEVADPYTKKNILLPPSGEVISQIALSDSKSYPWFAPAGLNRGIMTGVVSLERSPSQGERDILYGNRNCINPLVKFTGTGIVIWGQKTTQRKCSALDRINVRRLLNYLKKVITAASRYYLFEPNDNTTWDKWIDMVQTTLETVKSQRGIYDLKVEMKPTSTEIDNYEMPGTIKIKPSKAAEYMSLNFMIMSTDTTFDENEI